MKIAEHNDKSVNYKQSLFCFQQGERGNGVPAINDIHHDKNIT